MELLTVVSRTVEVAAYDELLLGGHQLVQQVGELVTELARYGVRRSVDADDGYVDSRSHAVLCAVLIF